MCRLRHRVVKMVLCCCLAPRTCVVDDCGPDDRHEPEHGRQGHVHARLLLLRELVKVEVPDGPVADGCPQLERRPEEGLEDGLLLVRPFLRGKRGLLFQGLAIVYSCWTRGQGIWLSGSLGHACACAFLFQLYVRRGHPTPPHSLSAMSRSRSRNIGKYQLCLTVLNKGQRWNCCL